MIIPAVVSPIQARLKAGKDVIFTNVGNPQALGQPPLSFNREVLSLLVAPFLSERPELRAAFAPDALERAARYRAMLPGGSVGAYTDSRGVPGIREEVARFIERRDGGAAGEGGAGRVEAGDVFLTNGASAGVCRVFTVLLRSPQDAVLVPVPQYPLYSASTALHNGTLVPYYLDEDNEWAFDVDALRTSCADARNRGMNVRGLVLINPGNPTGQCMDLDMQRRIVRFCVEQRIVLLAARRGSAEHPIVQRKRRVAQLRPGFLTVAESFAKF